MPCIIAVFLCRLAKPTESEFGVSASRPLLEIHSCPSVSISMPILEQNDLGPWSCFAHETLPIAKVAGSRSRAHQSGEFKQSNSN